MAYQAAYFPADFLSFPVPVLFPVFPACHLLFGFLLSDRLRDFLLTENYFHKIIFRDINDEGNVLILTHIKNEGKGSALKTGLSYIQTNISDYCIVVTVDADGQHSPSDVEKICKEAQRYPGYLILGSRKIQKETPFKSKFGNRITRIVYGLITYLFHI